MPQLKLHEVAPTPVSVDEESAPGPGIPASTSRSRPFITATLNGLGFIQKYSTVPITLFFVTHLAGMVVAPALFGTEVGDEVIETGREVYQKPISEAVILGSMAAHVASGVLARLLRKVLYYKKYGRFSAPSSSKKKIKKPDEKEEVTDPNEGLGGIQSIFGFGSRRSFVSQYLGLSPLSFAGYLFSVILFLHTLNNRVAPLAIDGDSSYIDLSFVSYCFHHKVIDLLSIPIYVTISSYHIISGINRYLKLYSKKARRVAYTGITTMFLLSLVSCFRVYNMPPVPKIIGERFQRYMDFFDIGA